MDTALIFFIPTLVFSLAITMAITVPFTGVLVRYRANYNPKAVQLDPEGGTPVYTGPIVKSYFAMMSRVYRIEGWSGLYKGTMPTLLTSIIIMLLAIAVVFHEGPDAWNGARRPPKLGIMTSLIYSLGLMLISLPSAILTYRAITTPHNLPFFSLKQSLRTLLTPTERARPWVLYLTPGLLVADVLQTALFVLGLTPLQRLLLPVIPQAKGDISNVSIPRLSMHLVLVIVSTVIFTPLENIITRLAIQRNHDTSDYKLTATQDEAAITDEPPAYELGAAEEEPVIGLRNEADPYLGFADCAKRMIAEEGWCTLFRAWWCTLLGILAGAMLV